MSNQEIYEKDDVIIRDAVKDDMVAVFAMIKELAVNAPKGPKISEKDLARDGFGIQPPAFLCKIAESTSKKTTLGYALYFPTYSTWEGRTMMLEDLYVRPSSEKQEEISKYLFNSVAKEAIRHGSSRLDFHLMQQNPACVYYVKRGAVNLTQSEDWVYYRLSLRGKNIEQ